MLPPLPPSPDYEEAETCWRCACGFEEEEPYDWHGHPHHADCGWLAVGDRLQETRHFTDQEVRDAAAISAATLAMVTPLSRLCRRCGAPEGRHTNIGSYCPDERGSFEKGARHG